MSNEDASESLISALNFASHWDRLESRYRDTNYEGVGRADSVSFSARNSYVVLTGKLPGSPRL